ncbi:MAG: SDR family NAD(P)-dependent oxidoreductase, partial [Nannocystaceae bacterium]|nr:SDR family NAD(P)-dependent oxidoreductase [Nannocystaceae bacterium]
TVLVTGANSGVGLQAAAQLAESGWGTVILACRTVEKAEVARAALRERVGKDVFATLAIDTSEAQAARAAADELVARGTIIDGLVLNAGASSSEAHYNTDGVEITWASTLVGHHVLTMRLWETGSLSPHARIIIAGSEGARGTLPGMPIHDVGGLARTKYDGDQVAAIVALAKTEAQDSFVNMREYVTAKLVVAWWAAALARRLPPGMTVNAVSPGSAPGSNFARGAGLAMKVMTVFMKVLGPMMGMAGSLEAAARRYVDALEFGDDDTGQFYATAHPKKLVGPMARQDSFEHFSDTALQEAAFEAVVRLTDTPAPENG